MRCEAPGPELLSHRMKLFIERPRPADHRELQQLIDSVIRWTYRDEQIDASYADEMLDQIRLQQDSVARSLESGGIDPYILLLRQEGKIVGTISYGQVGKNISDFIPGEFANARELKTMYVLPECQGIGAGNLLMNAILLSLIQTGVPDIYFDCGYKRAQGHWIRRFGEPTITVKDHWGPGADHMVWHRRMEDVEVVYFTKA